MLKTHNNQRTNKSIKQKTSLEIQLSWGLFLTGGSVDPKYPAHSIQYVPQQFVL